MGKSYLVALYQPMKLVKSVSCTTSNDRQEYDIHEQNYYCDYTIQPATWRMFAQRIIAPENKLNVPGVTSEVTLFVGFAVEELVGEVWTPLSTGSPDHTIDAATGSFTLRKNVKPDGFRTFRMTANIKDNDVPGEASLRPEVTVSEAFTVFCVSKIGAMFSIRNEWPDGKRADVMKKKSQYRLGGKLIYGSDEWVETLYRWFRVQNGIDTEITAANAGGVTGYGGSELSVPYFEITEKGNSYKVKSDPIMNLQGSTVDASGDKCINLIPRSFWSTEWMKLNPSICPDGKSMKDADGEYWRVAPNLFTVIFGKYATFGGTDISNDIFSNRIKYKQNVVYTLSAKWKISSTQTNPSIIIYVIYVDDSYTALRLDGNQTSLILKTIISKANTTIKLIGASYGDTVGKPFIYDLQLLEGAYTNPSFRDAPSDRYDGWNASKELITDQANREFTTDSGFWMKSNSTIANGVCNINSVDGTSGSYLKRIDLLSIGGIYEITLKISRVGSGKIIIEGINPSTLFDSVGTFTKRFEKISSGHFTLSRVSGNITDIDIDMVSIREVRVPVTTASLIANNFGGVSPSENMVESGMAVAKLYPENITDEVKITNNGIFSGYGVAFDGECTVKSAQGDVVNPQYDYSCLWYKKPDGQPEQLYKKGFRIMDILEGPMNLRTEVLRGLENAEYAACGDGVDDSIRNSVSPFYDIVNSKNRVVVDFIYRSGYAFVFSLANTCSLEFAQNIMVRIFGKNGGTVSPNFVVGNRYIVDSAFSANGVDYIKINNVVKTLSDKTFDALESTVRFCEATSSKYSTSKIISCKIFDNSDRMIHCWDFQGSTPAERLKDKVRGLSGITPIDLTANNVANLNDPNPETGFFQPI